jgi:hypothetical protein
MFVTLSEELDAGLPPRVAERGQQVQIIDIELPKQLTQLPIRGRLLQTQSIRLWGITHNTRHHIFVDFLDRRYGHHQQAGASLTHFAVETR